MPPKNIKEYVINNVNKHLNQQKERIIQLENANRELLELSRTQQRILEQKSSQLKDMYQIQHKLTLEKTDLYNALRKSKLPPSEMKSNFKIDEGFLTGYFSGLGVFAMAVGVTDRNDFFIYLGGSILAATIIVNFIPYTELFGGNTLHHHNPK